MLEIKKAAKEPPQTETTRTLTQKIEYQTANSESRSLGASDQSQMKALVIQVDSLAAPLVRGQQPLARTLNFSFQTLALVLNFQTV